MSTLSVTILVVILTFAAVIAVGYALTRRTAQAQRRVAVSQPFVPAAPAPVYVPAANGFVPDRTAPPAAREMTPAEITWPRMIDDGIGDLSLDERHALIGRLAVVNDEWTLPILRRAVHEERDAALLDAVVDALIAKRPA